MTIPAPKEDLAAIDAREDNKPAWYVENARKLTVEAELFAASRQARMDEKMDRLVFEDITHHHAFARDQDTGELICFDRGRINTTPTPIRDWQLVIQPEDIQPR